MKADEDIQINLKPLYKQKKSRYVVWPSGYVFDRLPVWAYIFILVTAALIIFIPDALSGETIKAYVNCPPEKEYQLMGKVCENPLYGQCDMPACQKEFLYAGESIGEPPSKTPGRFGVAAFLTLGLLFFANHTLQKSRRFENVRNKYNQQERSRRGSD